MESMLAGCLSLMESRGVDCLEFISALAVLGYRLSSVFTFGVKTRLSIKPAVCAPKCTGREKINRCFSSEFCEFLHVIPVNSTLVSLSAPAPFNKFIIINLISVKRRCRLDGIPLSRRPFGLPMINFSFILGLNLNPGSQHGPR
jgi:hypothetical protein